MPRQREEFFHGANGVNERRRQQAKDRQITVEGDCRSLPKTLDNGRP